ncbi:IS3 family transposase [Phototrophicus methaneseepsis]|uniref:IS3 family transposase n=1 Tax=Phototrophicus methaneseepsis TaxID=2710758 RepID=UPI001E5A075C|nr:IS3 family transposase [Phototrophicus methaneseepsis]
MKSVCADALGINRKNIYRQLRQAAKDRILKEQIEAVHREHPAYGHRRIALHLGINHKRTQRVMAKFKLKPPRRRAKRYSTVSTSHHSYNNLLKDQTVTRPHQVWCSDLSRIVYRGTLWYIATIEDLFTRQIIAQRMGKRHDSHLVLATLQQALATGCQPQLFHSDQGNEFMAQRCTDYLEQRGIQVSVSDVASPWQNGCMESFFGRFKHELGDLDRFDSPGEMIEAIYHHIHYYNHHRIHTALKMPPATFAAKTFSDNGLHVWGT